MYNEKLASFSLIVSEKKNIKILNLFSAVYVNAKY